MPATSATSAVGVADTARRLRQLVRSDGVDERVVVSVNGLIEELRSMMQADARLYGARLTLDLAPDHHPDQAVDALLEEPLGPAAHADAANGVLRPAAHAEPDRMDAVEELGDAPAAQLIPEHAGAEADHHRDHGTLPRRTAPQQRGDHRRTLLLEP